MLDIKNCDCKELMKEFPDKHFDLAIVDPPYGIDVTKMELGSGKYKSDKGWDSSAPDEEYFRELFRVSKNQIIWGANHFLQTIGRVRVINTPCWLVWNKNNGTSDFADAELAWTSFENPVRLLTFGLTQQPQFDIKNRFHPTQKPTKLYEWILSKFATEGMKILDTHLGSGSIAIACHGYKVDLVASEIDKEYFDKAMKRINLLTSSNTLF